MTLPAFLRICERYGLKVKKDIFCELMVIVTNFAELNLWNLNWHIRNTNRN